MAAETSHVSSKIFPVQPPSGSGVRQRRQWVAKGMIGMINYDIWLGTYMDAYLWFAGDHETHWCIVFVVPSACWHIGTYWIIILAYFGILFHVIEKSCKIMLLWSFMFHWCISLSSMDWLSPTSMALSAALLKILSGEVEHPPSLEISAGGFESFQVSESCETGQLWSR